VRGPSQAAGAQDDADAGFGDTGLDEQESNGNTRALASTRPE
jgi:hypothetical protein